MRSSFLPPACRRRGYTLIEMLVVIFIVILMLAMVGLAVGNMLRASKLNNAVGTFIGAVDEARASALALRCAIGVDLTRLDDADTEKGIYSRITTIGPHIYDPFEVAPSANAPWANNPFRPAAQWEPQSLSLDTEGTRCLLLPAGQTAYHTGFMLAQENAEDYEVVIQARIRFKPTSRLRSPWSATLLASLGAAGDQGYGLTLTCTFDANTLVNRTNAVRLEKAGALLTGHGTSASRDLGANITMVREGVWYRFKLSVKRYGRIEKGQTTPVARVAGKVWVEGQLEPPGWVVGPSDDDSPLANGYPGLLATNCDLLVDDFFADQRTVRNLPVGVRVEAMKPDTAATSGATVLSLSSDLDLAEPHNFPLVFRPDGTAATRYVIRLVDMATGDQRFMVIDQTSGRIRPVDATQDEFKAKVMDQP